ncbi:unnamed protein product [Litomosoides sigmodontis]|uniref:Uncharacterized protein n=1 Tax=Litomosoides sigmodontis TaxID=42156 RepID=A0A3P6RZZ7_LITSI|nr:unnamed protein product [Litomosoides sigmodontis]
MIDGAPKMKQVLTVRDGKMAATVGVASLAELRVLPQLLGHSCFSNIPDVTARLCSSLSLLRVLTNDVLRA